MKKLLENPAISSILIAVTVIIVCVILSKILRRILDKYFDNAVQLMKGDPTNYNFFKNGVTFIIFVIGTIIIFRSIPALKGVGNTLVASAGILAAIVGFASQQAFSNIVGGIFIVIFKPFRVGDVIKVGTENPGTVEDITLRHTIINSFENRRIVIPNSVISSATILNSSIAEEKVCVFVEVGIGYSANIDQAIAIIREEAMKHPNFIDNREEEDKNDDTPAVVVRVVAWMDSSITLRASVWADTSLKGFVMKCELLKSIKEAFDREGVEIPYPYRNLVIKSNEAKSLPV
ncbi:mechanosensitive ion channel family protein [uncultured Microscilla sp.]|uniref:mechanosensitive ion channel family protein n=1 Tax=uncultured Microscilla sp. TaxID=432653 RepID=UPI0026038E00|nr:mechanosensitive ion channel family protein [uncultured Microscilla sp.]